MRNARSIHAPQCMVVPRLSWVYFEFEALSAYRILGRLISYDFFVLSDFKNSLHTLMLKEWPEGMLRERRGGLNFLDKYYASSASENFPNTIFAGMGPPCSDTGRKIGGGSCKSGFRSRSLLLQITIK